MGAGPRLLGPSPRSLHQMDEADYFPAGAPCDRPCHLIGGWRPGGHGLGAEPPSTLTPWGLLQPQGAHNQAAPGTTASVPLQGPSSPSHAHLGFWVPFMPRTWRAGGRYLLLRAGPPDARRARTRTSIGPVRL